MRIFFCSSTAIQYGVPENGIYIEGHVLFSVKMQCKMQCEKYSSASFLMLLIQRCLSNFDPILVYFACVKVIQYSFYTLNLRKKHSISKQRMAIILASAQREAPRMTVKHSYSQIHIKQEGRGISPKLQPSYSVSGLSLGVGTFLMSSWAFRNHSNSDYLEWVVCDVDYRCQITVENLTPKKSSSVSLTVNSSLKPAQATTAENHMRKISKSETQPAGLTVGEIGCW